MAAKGEKNCLDGKHANTQIPKFIGAIKRYNVLKQLGRQNRKMKHILWMLRNFLKWLSNDILFVTGGISVMEHFRKRLSSG